MKWEIDHESKAAKKFGKEMLVVYFKLPGCAYLDRLRKTLNNFSQDSV